MIARACGIPAFTWDEIDGNPVLEWAITQCATEREELQWKAVGNAIYALDYLATLQGLQVKDKSLDGFKSVLDAKNNAHKVPKIGIDPRMIGSIKPKNL